MYCSKGHENFAGSRYCLVCGEKLDSVINRIQPGIILGDRYRIVRQLGQGGFGRTYLAEDLNRFNELCVLKEFAPQVQGTQALQKGQELFQREAGVLYKLQHPQIPRFRELFRANFDDQGYLFLVQDYVEGSSYHALLNVRKQQGISFNEAEVTQLLLQLLPVLEYIHALGVIHRDISPDNIILRKSDYLPVLIDFGGVKEVAATVVSQFGQTVSNPTVELATRLGKVGYAPHEQIFSGNVSPQSDLYALAATVLVLLTGKEPQELIDDQTLWWNWRREVSLSPNFGNILDKMLMPAKSDRPSSAREILQALTPHSRTSPVLQAPPTIVTKPPVTTPVVANSSRRSFGLNSFLIGLLLFGAAAIGWWGTRTWLQSRSVDIPEDTMPVEPPVVNAPIPPTPQYSATEQRRKEQLRDRRQQLGIDDTFYNALVNQAFWDKYPELRSKPLSTSPTDESLRREWDAIAAEMLDKLQALSPEARKQLGNYKATDRDRWKVAVNKLNVSSRALYDLTDATFFQLFPKQQGQNFVNQPLGQVWHGIAADKLQRLLAGGAYEKMTFASGTTSQQLDGSLQPGEGKTYIAQLAQNQSMQLNLEADAQVLISVYSPSGEHILLEDSRDRTWSGNLPESGYYEFVVVSTASKPIDYQLNIGVE